MATQDWTRTALPLAVLTAACAIPLGLVHPLLGAAPVYISALTGLAVTRTTRVAKNADVEQKRLREATAAAHAAKVRAEAAHDLYLEDHERVRGTFAEVDRRAAEAEAATVARLEREYADRRATEVAEYYAQGVADGEAGIWRLPDGNLVSLDEHRHPPQPPTGSTNP